LLKMGCHSFFNINSNREHPESILKYIAIGKEPPPTLCSEGRLYPLVARDTGEYKRTYNNHTDSERVNDRIPNDYHLYDIKIHDRKILFHTLVSETTHYFIS